jgi:hypothetical protein
MVLTHDEAASRGCPMRPISRRLTVAEMEARFQPGDLGNGVIPTVSTFAPCLHERCMAWRWEDPASDSRALPDSYRAVDSPGREPRGYCGIAGMPALVRRD